MAFYKIVGLFLYLSEYHPSNCRQKIICPHVFSMIINFIEWLNKYKYPYKKSVYDGTIRRVDDMDEIPELYKEYKWYNF